MKMRNLWCLFFVVSLPAESFEEEKTAVKIIGILGESVTFHLKTSELSAPISWFRLRGTETTHIATVEDTQPCEVRVFFPKMKGRLDVSGDCRDLQITDLHPDDSGQYTAQMGEYLEKFMLEVYKAFEEEQNVGKIIGILGESVTFHLKTSERSDPITWLRLRGTISIHIATMQASPPCGTQVVFPKLEGRLDVSGDCRDLQITDLHPDDYGEYTAQIGEYSENFMLEVYKNLLESDLKVRCENYTCRDGNCTAQLNCSAGEWEDGVNYTWTSTSKGGKISSPVVQSPFQDGDMNYTCTAENPVSKASKTVSVKQTCEGAPVDSTSTQPSYVLMGVTTAALIAVKVLVNVFVVYMKFFSANKQKGTRGRCGESGASGRSRR
ncbi:SLAM family member 9-like [Paroedura picta]|uniref:SLAM family member 9-like n=1 Tax=Paroedura picta TaxID=143630 RepID=UPI004056ABF1